MSANRSTRRSNHRAAWPRWVLVLAAVLMAPACVARTRPPNHAAVQNEEQPSGNVCEPVGLSAQTPVTHCG